KRLGVSPTEVRLAVQRLQSIDMLEITEDGQWLDRAGDVTTVGNEFTHLALQKFQRQILEKAVDALQTDYEKRDQSSMTMAIDTSQLPKAKALIKNFRRDLCALLQETKHKDQVYHLAVSL